MNYTVYISTYASTKDKSIYFGEVNSETGEVTLKDGVNGLENPSFLAIHPNRKFVYAACETYGPGGGTVAALARDEKTGALTLLNQQPAKGAGPCHLVVDGTGKNVLVASYGSGSVACLPLRDDGRLEPPSATDQHTGSSVNKQRQNEPHAHSINISPENRFAVAADLGTDKLYVYRFDAARNSLTPNDPPATDAKPGAGPRHFDFHPTKPYAYAINELDSTITAYKWDGGKGILTPIETVPALPEGFTDKSTTSEVQVHPSGKFVYGANRGHDSIVICAINERTGGLKVLRHVETGGKNPRHFGITPDGRLMLVACQDSGYLSCRKIDVSSGNLQIDPRRIEIPRPVCVQFV